MVNLFLVPQWFIGYDLFLELGFALICLLVSFYSFKVYRLTLENSSKLYAISFLFISLSYFIQSFINILLLPQLFNPILSNNEVVWNIVSIYVNLVFFTMGLLTLTYMTFKIKNSNVYSLLLITTLFSLILSYNRVYLFYVLTSIFLAYISLFYLKNYINKRKITSLLVFIAFCLLLFSQFHFILSVNHSLYYMLGHFFELIAYILILLNLVIITKNGKKTRKITDNI